MDPISLVLGLIIGFLVCGYREKRKQLSNIGNDKDKPVKFRKGLNVEL